MREDWEQVALLPGSQGNTTSIRGWLEHRSRIQGYPNSVRAAWLVGGGIWDCLRTDRIPEARARAALAVCALVQQACDSGSWVLASGICLESPPPMSSFSRHAPSSLEFPHSKLIDPRWIDLAVSKVKDLADYHEKRARLSNNFQKKQPAVAAEDSTSTSTNCHLVFV